MSCRRRRRSQPLGRVGGRPDWLVEGTSSYHESVPPAAAAPLSLAPVPVARAPGMRESPPELVSRRPAPKSYAPPPPQAPRPQAQFATGAAYGHEGGGDLPLPLRIGLRIALGAMLFVMIAAVRHCRVLDRDVDRALSARPNQPRASGDEPARKHQPAGGDEALGPIAHDWMESDLHVFTNGDKDRVSNLIRRLDEAARSRCASQNHAQRHGADRGRAGRRAARRCGQAQGRARRVREVPAAGRSVSSWLRPRTTAPTCCASRSNGSQWSVVSRQSSVSSRRRAQAD